jgi:hypothetical protein
MTSRAAVVAVASGACAGSPRSRRCPGLPWAPEIPSRPTAHDRCSHHSTSCFTPAARWSVQGLVCSQSGKRQIRDLRRTIPHAATATDGACHALVDVQAPGDDDPGLPSPARAHHSNPLARSLPRLGTLTAVLFNCLLSRPGLAARGRFAAACPGWCRTARARKRLPF